MLEAERDSNNCDAEDKPEHKVKGSYLPPSKKDPDKVHHSGEAPGLIGPVHKLVAKRPQGISAQFKKLDAKGNAHYGDAH